MPTGSGMKNALVDYGLGLTAGIVYSLSQAFTGSGLIGGIIGAIAAGSIVKGERGTAIATTLGFNTIVGSMANANTAETNAQMDVM